MKKKLIDYKQDYENLTTKKNLSGNEALKAVEEDGYALQYVKDQLCFDLQESKPLFILDGIEYSEGTARSMIKKATE